MFGPCPPPQAEALALLPKVLDRFRASGSSRQTLPASLPPTSCVQLRNVRICGRVTLSNIHLKATPIRSGCCLTADCLVPVQVEYSVDGCPACVEVTLCLPLQGSMRVSLEQAVEFYPKVELRCPVLSLTCGCPELCFDFCTEVFVVCPALFRLPQAPPEQPDCRRFFDLPLYPSYGPPHP